MNVYDCTILTSRYRRREKKKTEKQLDTSHARMIVERKIRANFDHCEETTNKITCLALQFSSRSNACSLTRINSPRIAISDSKSIGSASFSVAKRHLSAWEIVQLVLNRREKNSIRPGVHACRQQQRVSPQIIWTRTTIPWIKCWLNIYPPSLLSLDGHPISRWPLKCMEMHWIWPFSITSMQLNDRRRWLRKHINWSMPFEYSSDRFFDEPERRLDAVATFIQRWNGLPPLSTACFSNHSCESHWDRTRTDTLAVE